VPLLLAQVVLDLSSCYASPHCFTSHGACAQSERAICKHGIQYPFLKSLKLL